ncbi:MAG: ABC transporter substrate-binding protein [Burkholderiales bacterium]|jgi:branched-chain amino acid transport system substrate-binding protein|nr:ABC transporter substrate-binding protein [Burkholderiales bacterium]
MKKTLSFAAAGLLAALALQPALAQETIKIVNLLELSGPIASAGTNYRNGVEMAVKEINDAGGVLGRKFELTTLDNQSNPGVAKAMAVRAVDMDVFAVIGPTYSTAMVVSMNETRRAEIPNFTGAAAAAITGQQNPYVLRTNSTQADTMPKVVRYIKEGLKAQTVDLVWINSDFGKGGRDEFLKAAQAAGLKVVSDISTEQAQLDFSSAVIRAKQSNGDVLFAYTNEEESARLLRELRKQGYSKPIVGDTTLVSQKAIELAGGAANGVYGHVPLTADAPTQQMREFDQKYMKAYKVKSDHNGIQGYMVPYIIKAVSEKIGKVDRRAFAAAVKDMPLYVKDYPGLLMDMKFNTKGDADRVSYLVEIKDGKQVVVQTLPPLKPF